MSETGGSVRYLRRKNLGNYEHEELSVELPFTNGELDATIDLAISTVHTRLGLAKPTTGEPVVPKPTFIDHEAKFIEEVERAAKAPVVAPLRPVEITEPVKVDKRSKAYRDAHGRGPVPKAEAGPVIPLPQSDPLLQPVGLPGKPVVEDETDPLLLGAEDRLDEPSAGDRVYTPDEMLEAAQAACKRLGSMLPFKTLLFKGYGVTNVSMIPPEKTPAFMDDIAKLTA